MERVTFSRTGVASYFKHDLTVGSAATGILRTEWLKDPVSGILQPYLKLEAAATNSCLQSQALATAPWTTNLLTATNNAAVAPDGTTTASSLIPTAVSSAFHQVSQTITVTAGEYVAISGFFKANGYPGLQFRFDGVSGFAAWYADLVLGTIAVAGASGYTAVGSAVIPLGNGLFWLAAWGKTLTDTTVSFKAAVYDTAAHANTSTAFTGDGTSGIYAWGLQLERNGANALPPTSYITTTTIAVTRNVDSFSVPYFIDPKSMANSWMYLRFWDVGGSQAANFSVPLVIGNPSGTRFLFDNRTKGVWNIQHNVSGGSEVDSQIGTIATYGQVQELLGFINANGSVQLRGSVNAAADVVGALSGANALASTFGTLTLILGGVSILISRIVVGLGAGVSVNTIQDVRSIP